MREWKLFYCLEFRIASMKNRRRDSSASRSLEIVRKYRGMRVSRQRQTNQMIRFTRSVSIMARIVVSPFMYANAQYAASSEERIFENWGNPWHPWHQPLSVHQRLPAIKRTRLIISELMIIISACERARLGLRASFSQTEWIEDFLVISHIHTFARAYERNATMTVSRTIPANSNEPHDLHPSVSRCESILIRIVAGNISI
jgi:hypothetical protein